jgi:hypothetical protein
MTVSATPISAPEFDADGVMKWERVVPPYFWANANKLVVADRHLPDGTRQHMVPGHVAAGAVVDNAQIIGQLDALDAQYSRRIQIRSATPVDSMNEGGMLRAVDQQLSVHSKR